MCADDIILRRVLRRRQQLNHTRFWQALMEMLEGASEKAAPSLRLPDYTVRTCCGRWLTKPLRLVPSLLCLKPRSDYTEFILDVPRLRGTLSPHVQHPAQRNPLFSVLLQCLRCRLPQPHPPLRQLQPEVSPSEVLCAVLTTVNAQGFMLYFWGEEILSVRACEV